MKKYRNKVPCNGCTLCCSGDLIRLTSNDNPSLYLTEPHPYLTGVLMLAHKKSGDCIYLDKTGCSIHAHAPELCRTADCRALALIHNFSEAMKLHDAGLINIRVWDRGNELLKTLRR